MNIEEYRNRIVELLMSFDTAPDAELREQVLSLIPIWDEMNNLGCALLPVTVRHAARERLLQYFQRYPFHRTNFQLSLKNNSIPQLSPFGSC